MNLLVFKATGSNKMGLGHINRCLNLIKVLPDDWNAQLWVNNDSSLYGFLAQAPCPVLFDYQDQSFEKLRVNLVIYDELETNSTFLKKAKQAWNCPIVALDNFDFSNPRLDRIINLYNHGKQSDPKVFESLNFSIISDVFKIYRQPFKSVAIPPQNILVMFGGADPKGLTLKALDFLKDKDKKLKITVIIGPLCNLAKKIKNKASKIDQVKEVYHAPQNLAKIMSGMDLAFSGCATTFFELSFLGVPGILFAQNEMEERFINHLFTKGLAQDPALSLNQRFIQINQLEPYNEIKARQLEVFDGRGAQRILKTSLST